MGLFERRQPRGFQHQPRFHDERKDRLRILERNEGVDEIPFQNKDKYRDRLRACEEKEAQVLVKATANVYSSAFSSL